MAKKKPKTVGERLAAKLFPCVNVYNVITVAVPYHTIHGFIPGGSNPEELLTEIRQCVANYVDRLVAKEGTK